ncbi:hypothetical protein [Bradyrhizobium sp. STM 3566]|uniref:hypothetical protein n=2 Tax=Nitrobacteraceae TaxID=41294 RepID=UPI00388FE444
MAALLGGLLLRFDLRGLETASVASVRTASVFAGPGTGSATSRYWPMRIREENRNMILLATVTLCCSALAGTLALFEPVLGPAPEKRVAEGAVIDITRTSIQAPVRVVGAPFEPNVNPRER